MDKLLKHLENVNRRVETWPQWQKDILNQRIGGAEVYDNSVCRDHFPNNPTPWAETDIEIVSQPKEECLYFEIEPFKFDDTQFRKVLEEYKINIQSVVDDELYTYLEYKTGVSSSQLRKWFDNCNNIKLKNVSIHSIRALGQTEYYDGNKLIFILVDEGSPVFRIPDSYYNECLQVSKNIMRFWDKEEK